ncbi:hypothetical protein [Methylopila turkensis]|uniref:Uncharacterized protein n=1 Tax=Methylopila turkensis TaxID=1437816 RepID=A0A9W6JNL7_9HYPH|nr:hypothetical protein [Methylopila turkensis]GLK80407.1 hypothetical protein GCM10008174_21480 [Methylopila turkensis]
MNDMKRPFAAYLADFNRKERYWLLRDALGPSSDRLSASFLEKFEPAWRPSAEAWWAMDYHFDWMVAAIWQAGRDAGTLIDSDKIKFAAEIKGTQEDVDLIIADEFRIWLCEAKFGGALSQKQMTSKMQRVFQLKELADFSGLGIEFIEVDALPRGRQERRRNLNFMKQINVPIDAHVEGAFFKVTRTDFDSEICRDFDVTRVKV